MFENINGINFPTQEKTDIIAEIKKEALNFNLSFPEAIKELLNLETNIENLVNNLK